MKKEKVFILNYAPHYRKMIYKGISKSLEADFYFGNIPGSSIKKIDYFELPSFKKEFKTLKIGPFYWYFGSINILNKSYEKVVLTGDPYILSNWVILIMSFLLRKKTYLWTHGWYGKEKGLKKIIKLVYYRLATELFLYGEYSKNMLAYQGFDRERLNVVYNSLDYDLQLSIRGDLVKSDLFIRYFNNSNPVLIYIGRIQRSKKLEQVLEAMTILKNKNILTNFVIIGGEDINYNFREEIKKYQLENEVLLLGELYNETKIANLIYNSNLCVSPGNIGLTAIHSLMFGTPVLTHNNFKNQMPEFEAIIEGFNGGFFEENNIIDLGEGIKRILKMKCKKEDCFSIVDEIWNTNNQIKIFKKVLE